MKKPEERISTVAPFGLRMPSDVRSRLQAAADANNRSLNTEILAAIEAWLAQASEAPKAEPDAETIAKGILTKLLESPDFADIIVTVKEARRERLERKKQK